MKKVVLAFITGGLFAALTVMLGRYDVKPAGPAGTDIGFASVNKRVHDMTGVNMLWYDITEYLGYAAIGICLIFALAGLIQLIKRRSLLKVDGEILALGGLFAAAIAAYAVFEKFVINYRPIIMEGEQYPEASYPSSHTVLIICVMLGTAVILDRYVRSPGLCTFLRLLCVLTALVTVGGRLWSGAHWLTDIIGGILLSLTMVLLFGAVISSVRNNRSDDGDRPERRAGREPVVRERDRVIDGYVCKH